MRRALLLTAAALLPFLAKPYHIDDTVFLRIARQIAEHPLSPYEFQYNWTRTPIPVWVFNLHPPLHAYALAAVCAVTREREVPTHLACLGWALACAALMWLIARRLCREPEPAVLAAVAGPAFLVSATNVMADIPLLAFWLLAVYAALRRAGGGSTRWLWLLSVSAACAAMTKYFGLALVPLLAAYLAARRRGNLDCLVGALLPIAAVSLWGFYSMDHAGFFHPLASAGFGTGTDRSRWAAVPVTLSFLGGCTAWPLLAAPALASRMSRLQRGGALALFALAAAQARTVAPAVPLQFLAMAAVGCLLCVACAASAAARPDPETLLLSLWFFGTLGFAALLNWSVNARILLPAAFPAALLVARWLEESGSPGQSARALRRAWPAALALSLILAASDYRLAAASRDFASAAAQNRSPSIPAAFVGHWGFQYYMERAGFEPFDYRRPDLPPGARLYVSLNNSGALPLPTRLAGRLRAQADDRVPNPLGLATTDVEDNTAGFYSSLFGAVPFSYVPGRSLSRFLVQDFR